MAVVILGARGQARVLLELMERAGIFPIAGIVDDDPSLHGTKVEGIPVLGPVERLPNYVRAHRMHRAVVAIGDNIARRRLAEAARAAGLRLPVLIHPQAMVSPQAKLGDGTVVMAGAVVQPFAQIGELCIINTKASVDHDCQLGDCVHVAPGATLCGGVTAGDGVLIGAGAVIIPEICIGDEAIVGAGSTVIRDIASRTTVVGSPARELPGRTGNAQAEAEQAAAG